MRRPFKMKGWGGYTNSPIKQTKDDSYVKALQKALQEIGDPSDEEIRTEEGRSSHEKKLHQRARQIQVLDYRKSQLKL